MRRTRFIMLMTLLAFFALFAITDAVPGQPLPQSQESKKMEITLPVIGTKIPISEEHKMPLLIAGILFVLVYYVPKAYVSMRDSLSKIKSQRAMLELERTRFELLKTKYEIEALKKQHKLGDITLSERVETTITQAVQPNIGVNDRKERKKQIILRQIREIDKRKIFIFRRLFAFVIDNALYIVTFSFLLMFSDMYLDMTLTDETVGFLSLAVFALYFVAMWATRDATIGKLIVGLRIVTVDGQPLTFKDALIRFIIWMPLSVPAFCWVFLDKKKQALYDKAAKTVVVTVRQRKKREL